MYSRMDEHNIDNFITLMLSITFIDLITLAVQSSTIEFKYILLLKKYKQLCYVNKKNNKCEFYCNNNTSKLFLLQNATLLKV